MKQIDFDKFKTVTEMEEAVKKTFPTEYSILTGLGFYLTTDDMFDCSYMAANVDKDRILIFYPGCVNGECYGWEMYLDKVNQSYLSEDRKFSSFDDLIAYIKG